jgi:hypothetical protein
VITYWPGGNKRRLKILLFESLWSDFILIAVSTPEKKRKSIFDHMPRPGYG